MKNVLLIGLGRLGRHIARNLYEMGHQVMAVDNVEERVNEILPFATSAIIGDTTNEDFLKSLGVSNFDVCIVAIGSDFQSSLETTSLLKELGATKVIARASRDTQAKFLKKNGADEVIYPEKQLARWAAIRYTANHVLDYIELDDKNSIFEVEVPTAWKSLSVGQIDIRKKYGINILGVKNNGVMNVMVSPSTVLKDGDTLMVLGEYNSVKKCFML